MRTKEQILEAKQGLEALLGQVPMFDNEGNNIRDGIKAMIEVLNGDVDEDDIPETYVDNTKENEASVYVMNKAYDANDWMKLKYFSVEDAADDDLLAEYKELLK